MKENPFLELFREHGLSRMMKALEAEPNKTPALEAAICVIKIEYPWSKL